MGLWAVHSSTLGRKHMSWGPRPVISGGRRWSLGWSRQSTSVNGCATIVPHISRTGVSVAMIQVVRYRRLISDFSMMRFTSGRLATLAYPSFPVRTERLA